MRSTTLSALLATTVLTALASSAFAASFQGVGILAGNASSGIGAVSGDGTTVVGSSGNQAFRWTAATGSQDLGTMPSRTDGYNYDQVSASAVSYDGSVVVGNANFTGASGYDLTPFHWSAATGMQPVPVTDPYATGAGVSANGNMVVGYDWFAGPYRTNFAAAVEDNWDVTSGRWASSIAVSADGNTVVGDTQSGPAFLWHPGMAVAAPLLGDSHWDNTSTYVSNLSPDGHVAVGTAYLNTPLYDGQRTGTYQVRWIDGALQIIPTSTPGGFCEALACSYDGSIIVGDQNGNATVWDADHGWRSLSDILTAQGVDLAGWGLIDANSISWDGHTVAGEAIGPSNQHEAFVATLDVVPEPASLALLALTLAPLALRRRPAAGR